MSNSNNGTPCREGNRARSSSYRTSWTSPDSVGLTDGRLDGRSDSWLESGENLGNQVRLGEAAGLPGSRDPAGDSCIVNSCKGSVPADRDIPHLHCSLLLAGLLLETFRTGLVVNGDQGSGRVDVVVGAGHSVTVPGLLAGDVVLLLVIGDLVLKVVLGGTVGILWFPVGASKRNAGTPPRASQGLSHCGSDRRLQLRDHRGGDA